MGVHQPHDHYKLALYTAGANLSPEETTAYTPAGEITGRGYEPGGVALRGYQCGLDGPSAVMGWSEPAVWRNASLSAYGALIYNASKGNRAVVIMDFGKSVISTDGDYRLWMPPTTAGMALIEMT